MTQRITAAARMLDTLVAERLEALRALTSMRRDQRDEVQKILAPVHERHREQRAPLEAKVEELREPIRVALAARRRAAGKGPAAITPEQAKAFESDLDALLARHAEVARAE